MSDTAALPLLPDVKADAVLSPCGTYRYMLTRDWYPKTPKTPSGPTLNHVMWVMLNPSVADADQDDRTLRKVQGFAKAWGFNGVTVMNLFALRSPDPKALYSHPDPVGPVNDDLLVDMATAAGVGLVVAAWGVHGKHKSRGIKVRRLLDEAGVTLHTVARTKDGYPGHPLYLADSTEPLRWSA